MPSRSGIERARSLVDVMRKIAREVVEQERPAEVIGIVKQIDPDGRKALVQVLGDAEPVWYPYLSAAPAFAEQEVVIGGGRHNRHIIDVKGSSKNDRLIDSQGRDLTDVQSTVDDAHTAATDAEAAALAAETAASNAASVAAAAKDTADVAYANAQNDKDEFSFSSAGVILGTNEEALGILMTVPAGRSRIITRVIYSMKTNNNTLTIQLMRRALNGTETVIHTTDISSGAITFPDSSIEYTVTDLDHYFCNVTSVPGTVNTIHCCLESVLIEA